MFIFISPGASLKPFFSLTCFGKSISLLYLLYLYIVTLKYFSGCKGLFLRALQHYWVQYLHLCSSEHSVNSPLVLRRCVDTPLFEPVILFIVSEYCFPMGKDLWSHDVSAKSFNVTRIIFIFGLSEMHRP